MKKFNITSIVRNGVLSFLLLLVTACGENSSPEGRMRIKLEDLHKEMIDSLQKQNAAILDSLSKIREDLRGLEGKK
ncbi:MAG: hypothetical protein WKF91_16985 [Segetibacter sp.]